MHTGYIAVAFTVAVEVSTCHPVGSKTYCFYTNGSSLSWNEAKEFCATRNSTLPIITDENIDNVFQQFIVDNYTYNTFIVDNDTYNVIENISVWLDAHARHVNDSVRWHWINGRSSGMLLI